MAVPPMRTVANSTGALSPSVTRPDSLTLAATAATAATHSSSIKSIYLLQEISIYSFTEKLSHVNNGKPPRFSIATTEDLRLSKGKIISIHKKVAAYPTHISKIKYLSAKHSMMQINYVNGSIY